MATIDRRSGNRMDARHVPRGLWRGHSLQHDPAHPQLAHRRRAYLCWLLCAGLLGAGLVSAAPAAAGHWPNDNCLVEATADPQITPADFWVAAQELVGHQVQRPAPVYFIAEWPEGHGQYGGATLAGCFSDSRWAVQITPPTRYSPRFAPYLIHELAHGVMHDQGRAATEHHCWMNATEFASRMAKWLYHHEHAMHPGVVGMEVLKEAVYQDQAWCQPVPLPPV